MTVMNKTEELVIGSIKVDQRCQPRAWIDDGAVSDYAEAMRNGVSFPPVVVFSDGRATWLADGFHRLKAAAQAGHMTFSCMIKPGGLREAILYSCRANATHGLRRTQEDKRRAVRKLIADPEWGKWSDREIAKRALVSNTFVSSLRPAQTSIVTVNVDSEPDRRTYTTKHGTDAEMDVSAIGRTQRRPVFEEPDEPTEAEFKAERFRNIRLFVSKISGLTAEPGDLLSGCEDPDFLPRFRDDCRRAAQKLADIASAIER